MLNLVSEKLQLDSNREQKLEIDLTPDLARNVDLPD